MTVSLEVYRDAKKEKAKLTRKEAQAQWVKNKRLAVKQAGGTAFKIAKKTDRRRKRAERADLKDMGLKETPKNERVSRKVSRL